MASGLRWIPSRTRSASTAWTRAVSARGRCGSASQPRRMVDFATAAGTTAAPIPGSASPAVGAPRARRLLSIDAYRGLVMLLLFGEVLRLCDVARALPQSTLWQELCRQQSHAQWVGLHLHDLIQPGFTFLVGVSIPLSIAARRAIG